MITNGLNTNMVLKDELLMEKKNIAEMILSHYENFLGDYTSAELYKNEDGVSIQFPEYKNVFEGCKTYVSFGVSNFSEHIHNKYEIIMNVDLGDQILKIYSAFLYASCCYR